VKTGPCAVVIHSLEVSKYECLPGIQFDQNGVLPEEFPAAEEAQILKSQFVISRSGHGGRRSRPLAFTEQGVAMLSSVLNSERAIQVNIAIMRAFVRLRQILATHKALAKKLEEMEAKCDEQFRAVFEAIRELMTPPDPARRQIGFRIERR
jgi:hypothetical protein